MTTVEQIGSSNKTYVQFIFVLGTRNNFCFNLIVNQPERPRGIQARSHYVARQANANDTWGIYLSGSGLRAGVEILGRRKLGARKPVFSQISLPLIFAEQSFRKHWKLIAWSTSCYYSKKKGKNNLAIYTGSNANMIILSESYKKLGNLQKNSADLRKRQLRRASQTKDLLLTNGGACTVRTYQFDKSSVYVTDKTLTRTRSWVVRPTALSYTHWVEALQEAEDNCKAQYGRKWLEETLYIKYFSKNWFVQQT